MQAYGPESIMYLLPQIPWQILHCPLLFLTSLVVERGQTIAAVRFHHWS